METLYLKENGNVELPPAVQMLLETRPLSLVMPWKKEIRRHKKGDIQESVIMYFRHKPQKPFIEEGFLEINGIRFKVVEK